MDVLGSTDVPYQGKLFHFGEALCPAVGLRFDSLKFCPDVSAADTAGSWMSARAMPESAGGRCERFPEGLGKVCR